MQESSTEEWKQKRMKSFGKKLKLQKKESFSCMTKSRNMCSEHWTRRDWPKLAEEIGTQWVEVDRNEKIRIESEQAGDAKHVPMNLKSRLEAPLANACLAFCC